MSLIKGWTQYVLADSSLASAFITQLFVSYLLVLDSFRNKKWDLAKLDCGLDQSPTVMVGEEKEEEEKNGKYMGIPNLSWAFVDSISNR